MNDIADKARKTRLERLDKMLDGRLDNPQAALEVLMSELGVGELQDDKWEALHAATVRDGKDQALAAAYKKIATARRLTKFSPEVHAAVLVHAANFFQGILGDRDGAADFLWRVLELVPDHEEAFNRLQMRFEGDRLKTLELYAAVAAKPPKSPETLASNALKDLKQLPSTSPLPDESCKKLVALAPTSPPLIDALCAHCRKTDRVEVAYAVRERAIENGGLRDAVIVEQRRALAKIYIGEAKAPVKAIDHVEALLVSDPYDTEAKSAAEKLLSNKEVGSRAAAALSTARRDSRRP